METRILSIKCPRCRTNKSIIASETIEATTDFTFENGICISTNNEYGCGVSMSFTCNNCGHRWYGRKGITIDCYSEIKKTGRIVV